MHLIDGRQKKIVASVQKKFQMTYGDIPPQGNSSQWLEQFEAIGSLKE
jgi:hypothetical protein